MLIYGITIFFYFYHVISPSVKKQLPGYLQNIILHRYIGIDFMNWCSRIPVLKQTGNDQTWESQNIGDT